MIDADLLDRGTRFPNLALMKLSNYYKDKGHKTNLLTNYTNIFNYDKVFISKVFTKTDTPVNLNFFDNVEYGGTGFNFDNKNFLSDEIEHFYPDYNLYNDYVYQKIEEGQKRHKWKYYLDSSIGFTTRFCFRQCEWCVNKNKTKIKKWSPIEEFYNDNKKYITLWDDNILGFKDSVDILKKLKNIGKPYEYKQGLDIRVLTAEKAKILSESKYHGDYIFAFDDYDDKDEIIPKLDLWRQYNQQSTKLYLLVAYKSLGVQDIIETFERIKILMRYGCLPYIMRYKNYKNSKYKGMYINLARWCNQPNFFKKMSFREFCKFNGEDSSTMRYMNSFKNENPKVAEEYFDMKYEDIKIF